MFSDPKPVRDGHHAEPGQARLSVMPTICFVGSGELFSDIVLRTAEAGLDRVRAIRMPDMATLALVMQADREDSTLGRLVTVVSDQRNVEAMLALADREPAHFADLKQVIAFEEDAFACELLAQKRTRLVEQRISLLPMNTNITTWVNVLRLIGSGGHYVPPHLLVLDGSARMRAEPDAAPDHQAASTSTVAATREGLTPRETEVLAMAADGTPNKAIAHSLDLSEHTVKLHMHRVIAKLGVKNRTEAAVWFHQHQDGA